MSWSLASRGSAPVMVCCVSPIDVNVDLAQGSVMAGWAPWKAVVRTP